MTSEANVIGIELLVSGISGSVAFFEEVLGWPVVFRGPAEHAPGEVAVLDAGSIAVTLFEPTADPGDAVADASPRVAQLILGAASTEPIAEAIRSAGVPVRGPESQSFVPPEAMAGVVGFPIAMSLRAVSGD